MHTPTENAGGVQTSDLSTAAWAFLLVYVWTVVKLTTFDQGRGAAGFFFGFFFGFFWIFDGTLDFVGCLLDYSTITSARLV